jgi:hypothetical protein
MNAEIWMSMVKASHATDVWIFVVSMVAIIGGVLWLDKRK